MVTCHFPRQGMKERETSGMCVTAGDITGSFNDQRMLRPIDRHSCSVSQQLSSTKSAELSLSVPPGLQQLLGKTTLSFAVLVCSVCLRFSLTAKNIS